MNNIYIANNEDLFNIEIPNFEPEVVEKPLVSNDVKTIDNTVDSNFVAYSIIVFCTFLVIFVFLFLRKECRVLRYFWFISLFIEFNFFQFESVFTEYYSGNLFKVLFIIKFFANNIFLHPLPEQSY